MDGRRRVSTAQPQSRAELEGALGAHEDDLRPAAGGEAGRDQVGAFHQKGAFTLAELAMAQRRRPLHEGVPGAAEWEA